MEVFVLFQHYVNVIVTATANTIKFATQIFTSDTL